MNYSLALPIKSSNLAEKLRQLTNKALEDRQKVFDEKVESLYNNISGKMEAAAQNGDSYYYLTGDLKNVSHEIIKAILFKFSSETLEIVHVDSSIKAVW